LPLVTVAKIVFAPSSRTARPVLRQRVQRLLQLDVQRESAQAAPARRAQNPHVAHRIEPESRQDAST
jgi:hypothetical protein